MNTDICKNCGHPEHDHLLAMAGCVKTIPDYTSSAAFGIPYEECDCRKFESVSNNASLDENEQMQVNKIMQEMKL